MDTRQEEGNGITQSIEPAMHNNEKREAIDESTKKALAALSKTTVKFVPATIPFFTATLKADGVDVTLKVEIKDEDLSRKVIHLMAKNGEVEAEEINIFDAAFRDRIVNRAKELEFEMSKDAFKEAMEKCGSSELVEPFVAISEAICDLEKSFQISGREISAVFANMEVEE